MNRVFYKQPQDNKNDWLQYNFNNENYYIKEKDYKAYQNKKTKKFSDEELGFTIMVEYYFDDIVVDYKREVKLQLQEEFTTHYKSYKAINYTVDFLLITKDNREILVEIKGFLQRDKLFKYKIYDFLINKITNYEYYIVKLRGNEKLKNKTAYLYNQNIQNKIVQKRTINNFRTLVLEKTKD